MIGTVLVALDRTARSEAAVPTAAWLASRLGVPLEPVMVTSPGLELGPDKAYLEDVADRAGAGAGIGVGVHVGDRTLLAANEVAGPLLAHAVGRRSPLLVMGAHGRSGPGRLLLGSTSEEVVCRSRVPVVLVGPCAGAAPAAGPVVAWLDEPERAVEVLPVAAELSVAVGGRLELVVDPEGAAREIVERATTTGASLLVVTTHGRTGADRLAHGSVAAAVVHRAPCPVLVLGPAVGGR